MGIETNKQTHTISTRWLWISHRMQRWECSCRMVFLETPYKGQKHPRWVVYIHMYSRQAVPFLCHL